MVRGIFGFVLLFFIDSNLNRTTLRISNKTGRLGCTLEVGGEYVGELDTRVIEVLT